MRRASFQTARSLISSSVSAWARSSLSSALPEEEEDEDEDEDEDEEEEEEDEEEEEEEDECKVMLEWDIVRSGEMITFTC